MDALYVPVFVAPERLGDALVPCRAQIDTGSTLTIAGGNLAEALLSDYWSRFQALPPPQTVYTADNNPIPIFPIDSVLQVPINQYARFGEGDGPASDYELHTVNIPIYAGIKDDGGCVGWEDCDMLIGMDLLTRFCVTIILGMTKLELILA